VKRFARGVLAAALLTFGATGCDDDDDDVIIVTPTPTGLLTTQWSIDGSFAPTSCFAVGAYDFELVLYDDLDVFFEEVQVPCEDFSLTIDLPVGRYSADATLVDPGDFAISLTQILDDLLILESSELVVDVNFPANDLLSADRGDDGDEQALAF